MSNPQILSSRSAAEGSVFRRRHPTLPVVLQQEHRYYVYILASRSRTLYIGVTRTLRARVAQHRERVRGSFIARYQIDRLVYVEQFQYVGNAITREKELKDWNRGRKVALIQSANPTWEDLAEGW